MSQHNASSHTLFHTPSLTHNLSHTPITPSFTHHLSHHLSHTIFHTPSFTHTIFHSPSLSPIFVNLSHTHTSLSTTIAWQAWHLATCAFISRGRRGTYGTGLALVARSFTHHIFHSPSLSPIFVNLSHTSLSTTIAPTSLCGVLVFDSVSRALLLQPPASRLRRLITQHNLSSHTLFHTPSLTHNLSHTIFHLSNNFVTYHRSHTQLCHTQSSTHPLSHTLFTQCFTHHLSHTISHIIFHIPFFTHHLLHTTSFTHHLCHPSLSISHTHLCQPPLRGRPRTWRHVPSFHVAGVELMALGWLVARLGWD